MKLLEGWFTDGASSTEADYLRILPGPVIVVDTEMTVQYVNEAAAEVLGYSMQECVGHKCFDLFNADHCNTPRCAVRRAMQDNVTVTERTIAKPGGKHIPIQYTGIAVRDNHGQVTGGIELITDLTETYRVIDRVTDITNQLAQAGSELTTAASQAGEASQQVAGTSQQLASGATEQARMLQGSTNTMKQLEEVIDQVARGSREQSQGIYKAGTAVADVSSAADQVAEGSAAAAQGSQSAAELAAEGAEKTNQTVKGMERIIASVDGAAQKVDRLGAQSEEIGKIIAVIDDIAAQTNLLALNAAIEAARAGEHGRGFAVVSDEVKKLAERTATATKEIADLVTSVQGNVTEAVQAMEQGSGQVKEGYTLATEAGDVLEQIREASSNVSNQINQISAAAQEMSASSTELVTVIDGVGSVTEQNSAAAGEMMANSQEVGKGVESAAGIAEQNSAATHQMSASAEEMGAQVEQIVATASSFKDMATELHKTVAEFKV